MTRGERPLITNLNNNITSKHIKRMKKILYILSLSLLFISACSSESSPILAEDETPNSNGEQNISIRFSTNDGTEIDGETVLKKVIYAVYKTDDTIEPGYEPLVLLDSLSVEANIAPNITFDLETGKYIIVIFASGRASADLYFNTDDVSSALRHQSWAVINDTSSPNEFIGDTILEVGKQAINTSILLNRAVGKVEIVVTDLDQLPANIQSVSTHLETRLTLSGGWIPTSPYMLGFMDERYARFRPVDIKAPVITRDNFAKHGPDNPIVFYSLQTNNTAYPGSDNMWSSSGSLYLYLNETTERPTTNIPINNKVLVSERNDIEPNQINRYTGRVTADDKGFSLTVNDDWDDDFTTINIEN